MPGPDADLFNDPGYGETSQYGAHLDRGWALFDRGDLEAARTSASQALELRPEDPDAEMLQGAIAVAEGKPDEGLRCYERAIELDPEYLDPYLSAAQLALFDLEDPVRALRYCEDAADLEHLHGFDRLEVVLTAMDCELAQGDENAARRRLNTCEELAALEAAIELLSPQRDPTQSLQDRDPDSVAAAEYLCLDHDGERLEADERAERADRVLHLGLRVARNRLDVGEYEAGLTLTRRLVERFPQEADAWYVNSEIEHLVGDPRRSTLAALRTLHLDAQLGFPPWLPTPAELHEKVKEIAGTLSARSQQIIAGDSETPLPILVQEQPSAELVAEGVDPRTPSLSHAVRRLGPEGQDDGPQIMTALSVYVRNVVRFSADLDHFLEELRMAVLDELAAFLRLDNGEREALGLAPLPAGPEPAPAAETEETAEPKAKRSRRRNRTAKPG